MLRRLAMTVICVGSWGCAGPSIQDLSPVGLEAGLALNERTRQGGRRGLTHPSGDLNAVTRSADGRRVDLDSTIELVPLPDWIRASIPTQGSVASLDEVTAQATRLGDLVDSLTEYIEARDLTMRAHRRALDVPGPESRGAFAQARSNAAAMERLIIADLRGLPSILITRAEIQAAASDFALVVDLVSRELADLEARRADLIQASTFELRMEAFLRSPGKEPAAVHLPKYDSLDEGELVRRDRKGLLLDGAERARFEELARQSQRLSDLGNQYLDGQADLTEVFEGFAGTILADFGRLAQDVDRLIQEFEEGEAGDHLKTLESSARTLIQVIQADGREALGELDQELSALLGDIESGNTAKLRVLAKRIGALSELLENPSPASIAAGVDLIHTLATDGESWSSGIEGIVEHLGGIGEIAREVAGDMEGDVLNAFQESGVQEEFEYFENLLTRVRSSLKALTDLLNLGVPEAIDVDLDAAPPTNLRLRRTQRLDGDTLSLRMTVLRGGQPAVDPLLVDLDIKTLGWHARLDPSVVLARPKNGLAGSAEFRFAPAVSWLWAYQPGDDDRGFWDQAARTTGFGVGPHATFLSFDQNKEVEIGLGLTVSLWDGVLQAGIGYDLMANNGETYTFLGSSLIGLLQRLGAR